MWTDPNPFPVENLTKLDIDTCKLKATSNKQWEGYQALKQSYIAWLALLANLTEFRFWVYILYRDNLREANTLQALMILEWLSEV